MPKDLYYPQRLPREQPDRCELCPLIGIIPDEERRKGLRERYYCLGIFEALTDDNGEPLKDENGEQKLSFPRLKSKGIKRSAKAVKQGGHLLHRPTLASMDDTAWAVVRYAYRHIHEVPATLRTGTDDK